MNKRKIKKICVFIGLVLVAVITTALCFSYWVMESEPVSKSVADKIEAGMYKDTVQSMLGPPYKIYKHIDGGENWVYTQDWKWQSFIISFSKDGTVSYTEYDR